MTIVMLMCGITAAWAAQSAIVVQPEHGTMSISPVAPTAGQQVTITIIPEQGWEAKAENIVVELTTEPGNAQAPRKAQSPQVGETLPVSADTEANTFTFTMPDEPYGVHVSATLTEAPRYTITVEETVNGTVTADKTTASAGETVNLTITPDQGYRIESVTVWSDDETSGGAPVVVSEGDTDGQWSFVMPDANVIVQVVFDKSGTTAISDINADNGGIVRYYDINGRLVGTSLDHAGSGIFVTSDGRKVVK